MLADGPKATADQMHLWGEMVRQKDHALVDLRRGDCVQVIQHERQGGSVCGGDLVDQAGEQRLDG